MTPLFLTTLMLVQTITYPATRKDDVVDDYHGTKVSDPYRWLEDVDSPETRSWVEAENRVTFAYLERIPERERIRRRLTALWDYPKYGAPFKKGGRYFFFKNSGLQNQAVLYTQASLTAAPEVLLDPNTLSADGTVALSILAFAEDGRTMVYGTSGSGSDWQEFRVRDVATRQDHSDHLKWIKFSSAAWTHDGAGFFYSRYPEPATGADPLLEVNHNQKVYYHRLGTDQSADRLVYERPDHPTGDSASKSARTGDTPSMPCGWARTGAIASTTRILAIRNTRGSMPPSSGCSTTSMRRTASSATRARASFSRPTTALRGTRDRRRYAPSGTCRMG